MPAMFTTPYRVRFSDIDNAGIFYYPRFFHAFHVAFEQFWEEQAKWPYHILLNEDRLGFPTVHIEADFVKPIAFGAPMEIRLGLKHMGRSSLVFRYEMAHRETGDVHVAADITKVLVDMDSFKGIEFPDRIKKVLEPLKMEDAA